MADINLDTAVAYLDEAVKKYGPGTQIADVPSNESRLAGDPDLRGTRLRGQVVLQVPSQTRPIPPAVLDRAATLDVVIRQAPVAP